MNFNEKVSVPASIFAQQVDDEMVILDTQSEHYFGLDHMGTVMWEQLEQSASLEHLLQYMLEAYEVEEDVVKEDIKIFINNLVENKLITLG